jgi:hypothetical protein
VLTDAITEGPRSLTRVTRSDSTMISFTRSKVLGIVVTPEIWLTYNGRFAVGIAGKPVA